MKGSFLHLQKVTFALEEKKNKLCTRVEEDVELKGHTLLMLRHAADPQLFQGCVEEQAKQTSGDGGNQKQSHLLN